MPPNADDDTFRLVAVVVGSLAVLFVALLVAVQVSGSPGSVLSIPLLLAIPVVAAAVYYHVRFR